MTSLWLSMGGRDRAAARSGGLAAGTAGGGARLICMSSVTPLSRWRFVLAPRWLAWHAFAVVATIGMLWLGDWQFHRAEGGNALSWAYTFEWPVFAVFGLVFWIKTLIDESKPKVDDGLAAPAGVNGAAAAEVPGMLNLPAVAGQPGADADADEDDPDPELDEYNAYLARLNTPARRRTSSRPGGPS
jgi:hypothetical protein